MPDTTTGNLTPLTPPPRNPNLDAALQSISAPAPLNPGSLIQQKQNERQFLINKTAEQIDRNKELTAEEKKLKPPTLTDEQIQHYTSPPKEQHTNPIDAFGSAAMMVAVFGSMFTRQPLLNSLNAAGKVLDAYKRGDDQMAQQNFVEWKSATDAALKLHQIQYDAYHDALSRISQEKKEGWAELQGLAASFKDDTLKSLLEAGQLDLARQHIDVMKQQAGIIKDREVELEDRHETTHSLLVASKDLQQARAEQQAAQRSGNPSAVAAAQAKIDGVTQRIKDIQLITSKSKTAEDKIGKPIEIEYTNSEGQTKHAYAHEVKPGEWTDAATGQPLDRKPDTEIKPIKNTDQSGREATMIGRVLVAGADSAMDLKNITELPKDAAIGWFGSRGHATGPADALKKNLAQELTPEVSQAMDVHRVGIGRALAAMETGGVYINQELVNQYQSLVPQKGDRGWTVLRKLATIRQNAENSLEVTLANPRLADSQKKEAEKFVATIRDAVPWTVSDVTNLEFAGGENDTIKTMASKKGLGQAKDVKERPVWAVGSASSPSGDKIYTDGTSWFHADHTPVQ